MDCNVEHVKTAISDLKSSYIKKKDKEGWVETKIKDHRKAENPYQSLYGDSWLKKLKESSELSKLIDIRDLVDHIFENSKDTFTVDGVTDDSFRIYHDALSQLTDSACQKYLKDKGYFKYFIIPVLGCNDIITNSKGATNAHYRFRNMGDSPELMPLDTSIFADLMQTLHYHVARCRFFKSDCKYKFSIATPAATESAVARLWNKDAIPIVRINQDIERVADAMKIIVSQKGTVVYGWGDRNGWRAMMLKEYCAVLNKDFDTLSRKETHGGKRIKSETFKKKYCHPDVQSGLDVLVLDDVDGFHEDSLEAIVLDELEAENDDDDEDADRIINNNSNSNGNDSASLQTDDPNDPAKYYRFDANAERKHYCAYPGCTTRFDEKYLHRKHFLRVHGNRIVEFS